jgi:hypothetical protein
MEANRQSLLSRGACLLLAAGPFVPIIEYTGGFEPVRKSLVWCVLSTMQHEPVRWLILLWLVPGVLGFVRLSNVAFKAHVIFAAISATIAISWVLLTATDTSNLTLAQLQVYTGLEGVVPNRHYGFLAALVGGLSAIWMFDELWARREMKSIDGI